MTRKSMGSKREIQNIVPKNVFEMSPSDSDYHSPNT